MKALRCSYLLGVASVVQSHVHEGLPMNAHWASWGLAVAALGVCEWLSGTAFAVTAVNQSTNATVFQSLGFESDTPGTAPTTTGGGSWVSYHIDQVITGGTPGAFAGAKYVRTTRDNA